MKNKLTRLRYTLPICLVLSFMATGTSLAQNDKLTARAHALADKMEPKVIEWRRDFHQNPELANREKRTADKVAQHLKLLGMEVQTGIAHTGVVGILKGGKPGPVVALRADMDALPVTERVEVPFASKVRTTFNGQEVGIMHACGHDAHTAMLMATAEILAGMKNDLAGTVKFIFQPSEEGAPAGEEGGASLMIKEGVLDEGPKPEVIFGLHLNSQAEVGQVLYRPGGIMASADVFRIKVKGKQVHGANPWDGIDPIVVSAQIVTGLQTIVSRQVQLTEDPAVVSVGMIQGGVRNNIIPEEVLIEGTIRAFSPEMQTQIHEKIKRTATKIAESAGATAEVSIQRMAPVTFNDPALTDRMLPTLQTAIGRDKVVQMKPVTIAEDFAFYQQKIPGLFLFIGGMPKGQDPKTAPAHHTPDFFIDESSMKTGIKTLTSLTLDYMAGKGKK
ncbi:amidohydrolase [Pontibacter sp. JH31]|uniref:Amidohydrolase n=1 Tax=Pontibacter aquaedesilientis TaxID=2766980 RepID=A0ABR7XLW5_9BACT|nr:amidohydrolase [Pontibacter aquaedesilientis]MBD1398426.1 amidohydrolase [Pontibacter aquaedesilientis]